MSQQEHQDKITGIVKRWLVGFEKLVTDDESKREFLSVYDPKITWTDHAFQVRRTGHEAVLGLQKAFLHCNQPFHTETKAIHHTADGAVVEMIWIGRCTNDIVRPDGAVAVEAHGKHFTCHVCMVMEINPSTGITKIDEYYNKIWEDGIGEGQYHNISGASIKS